MVNFGTIRDNIYDFLAESMTSKDSNGKKVYKEFLNTIKNSKILRAEMTIYENLENKFMSSEYSAGKYLEEHISIMRSYSKKDIIKEHNTLVSILKKYGISTEIAKPLHKAIHNLLITEKSAKNINTIHESFENVKTHLMTEKAKDDLNFVSEYSLSDDMPPSMLADLAVKRFNTKYMGMDESDKVLLKVITGGDLKAKEELMESLINETIELIDQRISESDEGSTKSKLLKVKEVIADLKFNDQNYINDIVKINTLKSGLN